jgi:hypothetical protein
MPDNNDGYDVKKPKKKKITVPQDFLESAKSYDDKLVLVKYLTEKEKGRVLLILKKMLQPEPPKKPRP